MLDVAVEGTTVCPGRGVTTPGVSVKGNGVFVVIKLNVAVAGAS